MNFVPPVVDDDGDHLVYTLDGGQSDSGGARGLVYRTASRTPTGWVSADFNPPTQYPVSLGTAYGAASANADRLIVEGQGLDPMDPDGPGVFAVGVPDKVTTLVPNGTFVASSLNADVVYAVGYSSLAPGAEQYPDGAGRLYRIDGNGTTLASTVPASIYGDPDPDPDPNSGSFPTTVAPIFEGTIGTSGFDTVGDTRLSVDGAGLALGGGRRHVSSTDGSRVFFSAGHARFAQNYSKQLFPLWASNGSGPALPLSASRRTGEQGVTRRALFIGASADGGTAFFVTGKPLQNGEQGGGLYRYTVATRELTRLTPAAPMSDDEMEGFANVGLSSAWQSDDASTLYFVATSALTADAVAGERNAYVWHGGTLRRITSVGSDGSVQRVSRDGAFAVFKTSAGLGSANTGGLQQLYRYELGSDTMLCASCRSDGSANEGRSSVNIELAPNGTTDTYVGRQASRGITDDGTVIFTSLDRLVPEDPSDRADVYQFTGTGGVRLVSNGSGLTYLVDNTDDGKSVFMISTAPMLAADEDGGDYDLYVRRTGGGFPELQTQPEAGCTGDGCQAPPTTQPTTQAPGSDRVGAGNVRPPARAALLSSPRITAGARGALARGTRGAVSLRLRGPGTLTVRATGRVGGAKRTVALSASRIASSRSQTKAISIRLSRAARGQLRRAGRLRITVSARLSQAGSRSTTLTLRKKG